MVERGKGGAQERCRARLEWPKKVHNRCSNESQSVARRASAQCSRQVAQSSFFEYTVSWHRPLQSAQLSGERQLAAALTPSNAGGGLKFGGFTPPPAFASHLHSCSQLVPPSLIAYISSSALEYSGNRHLTALAGVIVSHEKALRGSCKRPAPTTRLAPRIGSPGRPLIIEAPIFSTITRTTVITQNYTATCLCPRH